MKIAFIVDIFPSVSETFVLNQVTGLIDLGHSVEIYAKYKGSADVLHKDINKYDLLNKTTYFGIKKNKIKRLIDGLFFLLKIFTHSPSKAIKSINIKRYKKNASSLQSLYLINSFNKKKYDIALCHFGPNGNLGLILKDTKIVNKVITVFHGYDISLLIKKVGPKIYNNLFLSGDLFLPISEYWKRNLIKFGCPNNKIIVHHMGVNMKNYKFKQLKRKKNEELKILSVGRFCQKKGFKYSIEAISKICQAGINVKYTIIGDGELKESLYKQTKKLSLNNNITFLGFLTNEEITKLIPNFDIFLLPSITSDNGDKEGIPVALMEAMASGIPVISTYHSGIPELITDSKSGFLVPEKNPDEIYKKILHIIQNYNELNQLTEQARNYIDTNFNISKLNKRLEQILEKTIY